MVPQDSLLATLVKLVDRLPMPALPAKGGRGQLRRCFPCEQLCSLHYREICDTL
jgi:hypothetical protein